MSMSATMGTATATARVDWLIPPPPPLPLLLSPLLDVAVFASAGLLAPRIAPVAPGSENWGRETPRSIGHVVLSDMGPSLSLMTVKYRLYATRPSVASRIV